MLLGLCSVLKLPDRTQLPQSGISEDNAVVDNQRDMNDVFHTRVLFEKDENKKVN
jgi:hypothetical protein